MIDQDKQDQIWLNRAVRLAKIAARNGEVPVAAIVVGPQGQLLGVGLNNREKQINPLGHAELIAIQRSGKKLKNWRLVGCTIYVTLEPCVMCAGALVQARVSRLVYGALDSKFGGVQSLYGITQDSRSNHRLTEVKYLDSPSCRHILSDFFKNRRQAKRIRND